MSSAVFACLCGQRHGFREVRIEEKLARCLDHANNVNKYWRIVHLTTPCTDVWLTHSGRWTNGWRDGGSWKKQASRSHAEGHWRSKTSGQYKPADKYGDTNAGAVVGYITLELLDEAPPHTRSRARSGAIAGQTARVVLGQAGLLVQTSTPVATPAANGNGKTKNGVDPLITLGQRTDTLVTHLATMSQLTPELATERAVLIAELSSYRERLEQVESTLEVATMLMRNKA